MRLRLADDVEATIIMIENAVNSIRILFSLVFLMIVSLTELLQKFNAQ